MGAFGDAMRGANISDEIRESDEDLAVAMTKLKSIMDAFLLSYGHLVIEVHATPMDILNRKLSSIDKIELYVLYDKSANHEEVDDAKATLHCLVDDEFEDVKGGVDVEFRSTYRKHVPTLCLYSVFPVDTNWFINTACPTAMYLALEDLIVTKGYTISCPANVTAQDPHTMFIHCGSPEKIISLDKIVREYDYKFAKFDGKKNKEDDVVYSVLLTQDKLRYDLPYMYLDASLFNGAQISNESELPNS